MNKKLVAVAIAGLLAAPLAQAQTANVTLYGRVNIDMEFVNGRLANNTNPNVYRVTSNSSRFGLRGPIVGFKFESRETVEASAKALRERVGAALVVANSLCGEVQALVDADGIERLPDRDRLLVRLAERVAALAGD